MKNMIRDRAASFDSVSTLCCLGYPDHSFDAMGSCYWGTLEQLAPDTFKQVRQGNLSRLFEERVTAIESNVIYAIATKEFADESASA